MNAHNSIVEIVQAQLSSEELKLPVFDKTVLELQRMLSRDDFSTEKCTALINKDQTLASQVLREANSSFYRGLKKVTTIRDAMVRLGAKEVLRLTLQVTQKSQYDCRHPGLKGMMKKLWQHALGVAISCSWLAKRSGFENLAQEAFLAGLMHDIGMLFLMKVLDEMASSNRLRQLSEPLVREVLDTMHVEQGYRLMRQWGMPEIYCDVVKRHRMSETTNANTLSLLVKLSNQACHKLGIGLVEQPDLVLATTAEAQALDIRETTLAELEIMLEDRFFPETLAAPA